MSQIRDKKHININHEPYKHKSVQPNELHAFAYLFYSLSESFDFLKTYNV